MSAHSPCQFRPATPQDAEAAVPLIYSSGPQAIDYGFPRHDKTQQDFLHFAFVDGKGFLGYQNHTVATLDDQVVGIAALYNLSTYLRLTLAHLWQLWRFYPAWRFTDLAVRGVHLTSIMPPPAQTMHYLANFAVADKFQNMGIGKSMLDYHRAQALALVRSQFALDVSVDNPRAQALYERYGFMSKTENQFSGPRGAVPNTRRMTILLKPLVDSQDFTSHPRSGPT